MGFILGYIYIFIGFFNIIFRIVILFGFIDMESVFFGVMYLLIVVVLLFEVSYVVGLVGFFK